MNTKDVILDIKQWGNNLGVRLPTAITREAHVHADQRVKLTISSGQIIITPMRDEQLTLEKRLAQFDPVRHSAKAMQATHQLGAEKW